MVRVDKVMDDIFFVVFLFYGFEVIRIYVILLEIEIGFMSGS